MNSFLCFSPHGTHSTSLGPQSQGAVQGFLVGRWAEQGMRELLTTYHEHGWLQIGFFQRVYM